MFQKAIEAGERQAAAAQAAVAQAASAEGAEIQVKLNEQQQQIANQLRQAVSPTNRPGGPSMNMPAGAGYTKRCSTGEANFHSPDSR